MAVYTNFRPPGEQPAAPEDPQGTTRGDFGSLAQKPERMYFQDLRTLEILTAQYNPTELEEALGVEWARLSPPGFSHKHLQYVGTENLTYTFDLIFDAAVEGTSLTDILRARRFLMSLCYARRGAQNVREGQAPRFLFVWPTLVSLTAVISGALTFKHETFNVRGTPTRFSVKMKLEEIRDVRLYSEDVRDEGTERIAKLPKPPVDASGGG